MKFQIIALVVLLVLFGCVSNQTAQTEDNKDRLITISDIEIEPITTTTSGTQNEKSKIRLDRVLFCNDEPNLFIPQYCQSFNNSKESSERLYIAAIVDNLECQNNSIKASCHITLFQEGVKVFDETQPVSKLYKNNCKPKEERRALCKIFVQGPTDVTKIYSANFEITDEYSKEKVVVKGTNAKIIPPH